MNAKELRELTPEQLRARVLELQTELADKKAAVQTGSEKNHVLIRTLRREAARTQTVLRAKLH